MKNENLYKILKEYCKAVTGLLKERLKTTALPSKTEAQITEFGPNAAFIQEVLKVDWGPVVDANEKVLAGTDVYQQALQAMMDDPTIAKHLNTSVGRPGTTGQRIEAPVCLRRFVSQLLDEQQGFDFQEGAFQKVYEGLEDFFYRDTIEYRVVCPLHNFQMQTEPLALSPKFSIIKFSTKEKERMLTKSGQLGSIGDLSIRNEFALEMYVEAPKVIGEIPQDPAENDPLGVARRAFDDACNALRLFKNGAVHYGEYWMDPTSWIVTGAQSVWPGWGAPGRHYGLTCTLSADEAPIFLEFLKSPRRGRMEKNKNILLAFNRLTFGYERLRPEDRLIDFMIGLEALFLDVEDELSYRLSLRVAALLGDTPEKRERIFTELRRAYGQRSKIAHGNNPKKDIDIGGTKIPFEELVNRVEEHLRSAIKEFLVRAERHSKEQVLDDLDLAIVKGFPTTN
jgi:Apea-like HEPN